MEDKFVIFPNNSNQSNITIDVMHPGSHDPGCLCMYACIKNYVRAAAYSLDCHEGAMINCRLYRTFQSLSVSTTETVTSSCRELSVVVSSTVLGGPEYEKLRCP